MGVGWRVELRLRGGGERVCRLRYVPGGFVLGRWCWGLGFVLRLGLEGGS